MMDNTIKGYIYHSNSYEAYFTNTVDDTNEQVNFVDIFYVNIDDKLPMITDDVKRNKYIVNNCLSCLRVYNFYVSFYIVKLPGMDKTEFAKFIKSICKKYKDINVKFKTTFRGKPLIESSYFNFDKVTYYAKIKSKSSSKLATCQRALKKAIKEHYDNIHNGNIELDIWDKMFYDNTESPFRNDMTTLVSSNVRYYLSTKYNIPCVGGFTFTYNNKQVRTHDSFPIGEYPGYKFMSFINKDINKEYKTLYIDMQKQNKIFHQIKHDDTVLGQQYLTLMSYDIETYESNLRTLDESEKIIMCIGVGIFNITNDKPFTRYCLSIKDFTEEDINKLGSKYKLSKEESTKTYTVKYVYNEYTDIESEKVNIDVTKYIICNSECTMFKQFIKLINIHRPIFITGFNNYGFDDRRMNDRMKYYGLDQYMDNILQYYDFGQYINKKITIPKQLIIKQNKFSMKIDGEMYNDNVTWQGESKSFMVDVYKIMLASNAKLYTQQGRGNLDTMLAVNNIMNPFNSKPLSKSGLSYDQMWFNWDNNKDIYDIMLYCCQDAWICGTLLIKSCQLIDKIEMSTLSCTTISDSIFKAVTWRVKHIIEHYAWDNNFAVTDSIINTVDKDKNHISRSDNHIFGNKQFDTRQIVGGEVKNVVNGKMNYVIALDFSAMYPSQKEGSNIDTSSLVPENIINDYLSYDLKKYHDDVNIFDMYKERKIMYFENNKHNKYIVEKFQSVFKNNIDEIKKTLEAMEVDKTKKTKNKHILIDTLRKLQPNDYERLTSEIYDCGKLTNQIMKSIPLTETRYLYTVQSPRDENNKVITHYSLKEIMLSDLRALRSKVKQQMENATNPIDKSRYNSKQLAIKVMCNSEYGASNSSYFPYYDPLIGGATTAASRCLINFLTNIIQTNKLYVNEQFISNNIKYIEHLHQYDIISYNKIKIDNPVDFVRHNRRFALRQLFDEYYNIIEPNIYELVIKPSQVVYQDTDSNYYTNEYVKQLLSPKDNDRRKHLETYFEFIKDNYNYSLQFDNFDEYFDWIVSRGDNYEDPTMINLKMNLLLSHNNLVGNFIKDAIYRKPVSVGFEGAFTTVRYFNVKKKYYGHVWNDKMTYTLPREYYKDNILQTQYPMVPGKSCYPDINGNYIAIDEQKLLSTETDKLAYIKKQNIKLTGVDLARRDQYKFININHIRLIQHDLHFLKYTGNNEWINISNENIYDIIMGLLNDFNQQFIDINEFVNAVLNNEENIKYDLKKWYSLNDYTKDITFKYTKANFLVCTTRQERYVINDTKEKTNKGYYKSECIAYSTGFGSLILTLLRNEQNEYISIYSDKYEFINCEEISPGHESKFYLSKPNDENNKDEFYIDYDCIKWDKKNKLLTTIGERLYKPIQDIKNYTQSRITDQTFAEMFPSGFCRKQYVILLTEDTKKDRLKGVKTETIKNSDKAYLLDELYKEYMEKLPLEEYNKLKHHDIIIYEQFIDLQIINNLDHMHYMEAFTNAISLYLIDYTKDILTPRDYNSIKHIINKNMIDEEDSNGENNTKKTIADIKKLISWELLIKIYPTRIRKNKPTIKQQRQNDTTLYIETISPDVYIKYLLSEDMEVLSKMYKQFGILNFKLYEDYSDCVTNGETEYNNNKEFQDLINNIYKHYCKTSEETTWRTIVIHSPFIIKLLNNKYENLKDKLLSFELLKQYIDTQEPITREKINQQTYNLNNEEKNIFMDKITDDERSQQYNKQYKNIEQKIKLYNDLKSLLIKNITYIKE